MGKFFNVDEVRKLCDDNNLKDKVNAAKNFDEVKKIIESMLPEGMNVSKGTVKEYIKTPKTPLLVNETSKPEDEHKKSDDESKIDGNTNPETTEKETIAGKTEVVKDIVLIDNNELKQIDDTKEQIRTHEKNINILNTQIEELNRKLNSSKEKNRDNLMFQIPTLNDLLNSGNEKITVNINKELLSKAAKFVDAHSNIRLESIIRNGYDLNSTIVQSILIEFIQQNSLL